MKSDQLVHMCYYCTKERVDPFSWDYKVMARRHCEICGTFGELVPIEKIDMGGFTIYAQVKQRMVGFYVSRDTALCK